MSSELDSQGFQENGSRKTLTGYIYYLDDKEVSEEVFRNRLWGELQVNISKDPKSFMSDEAWELYPELSPLNRTLAINMICRDKQNQILDENDEFELQWRYRKEPVYK